MTELGVVLIMDSSVDGFARVARHVHEGCTPLWAPSLSVMRRWLQFLTQPVVGLIIRFEVIDAAALALVRAVKAECKAPVIVQVACPSQEDVDQLDDVGVATVLPHLCLPSALEAALRQGAVNDVSPYGAGSMRQLPFTVPTHTSA